MKKQENLPPNVKNKIFCVLISMLETNIKRIIKLIDLLVKVGFSGHIKRPKRLTRQSGEPLFRNIQKKLSSHVVVLFKIYFAKISAMRQSTWQTNLFWLFLKAMKMFQSVTFKLQPLSVFI